MPKISNGNNYNDRTKLIKGTKYFLIKETFSISLFEFFINTICSFDERF